MPAEKTKRIDRHPCPHCGCLEGEHHKAGCPEEKCARCGGQRVACHHDDGGKRIPYIRYPRERFCVCCGEPRPAGFHVSDAEWAKYIEPGKRREYLCRPCYDRIKTIIDRVGRN